jgi:Transcriptional regulator, AbiEi antitoxin
MLGFMRERGIGDPALSGPQHPKLQDHVIARIASRQHGLVTAAQLLAAGLTREDIKLRVRAGRLHRIHRGTYAVGHAGLTVEASFNAAVLAMGPGATLASEAAAALYGAWRWEEHHDPQVLVPRAARPRKGIEVISRPDFKPDEWTRHNGIRVTTPARTVLDFAASHSFKHTRSVLRRLEAGKHISHPQLRAVLDAHPGAKGSATVRALLKRGPAPTRSTLEDATLEILDRLGVPRPQINERTARSEFDFTWPEHKLILEVDGPGFHGTPTTDAIDLEKEELAREAGFTVIRAEP